MQMQKNLMIKSVTELDIRRIAELEAESFVNQWSRLQLKEAISSGYSFYVISNQDKIMGYIIWMESGNTADLLRIAVCSENQASGLATFLVNFMINNLRDKSFQEVILEVRQSNLPAIKLYEKIGFKKITIRKKYYGDEDGVIYLLKLNKEV